MHFLLSNCRFWLDEYHVDGFRFDGVTSMLYTHHGLEKAFTGYDDYYKHDVDRDALTYLRLANQLIHEVRPDVLTVAEEMSGLPGVAGPIEHDGLAFDYRLAMGTPDLWIKTLKERTDEEWDLGHLFHTLSSHRPEEKVISYAESHDQALVGDKTLLFRLLDEAMYWHMQKTDDDIVVERGIALHKMIRLLTAATHGGGYLNFMGNEFGHPEWIDFPREGNDWSYAYARRQWNLADSELLKYEWLGTFDRRMVEVLSKLTDQGTHYVEVSQHARAISFYRDGYLFAFNFSPDTSLTGHQLMAPAGSYRVLLSTDDPEFGGQGRIDHATEFLTHPQSDIQFIKAYLPARTATVFQKID
jgi:1,4-alpha-glucan branching enzyme